MPDFMVPASEEDVARNASIQALRSLADTINAQGREQAATAAQIARHMEASNAAMEKMGDRLDNFGERIVRLEEQKHGRAIEEIKGIIKDSVAERKRQFDGLSDRLRSLEQRDAQRIGVRQFFEFVPKLWPIVLALVTAIVTWKVKDNG